MAPDDDDGRLRLDASLALWRDAERLVPGGSQTVSKRPSAFAFGRYPIFAARAEGARVHDVDGNEYIDFVGALGPISLGHRYPAVDDAVRAQLDRGVASGLLWPVEVEAAQGLVEAIPCAESVRFFKGGGEATAAAARIARRSTGRHLLLNAGYRGWPDTWAAGQDAAVPPALADYLIQFEQGDLSELERLLDVHRSEVAAVFTALPYDGSAGAEYLRGARELAHRHGALLVFDEIVHGFRLARGGMQEHFGVVPDLACFAKGIANGLPLAAVVGRRDVMDAAVETQMSITYGGEALSLAACVAVLREYRDHDVIGRLWRVGRQLMEGLDEAAAAQGVPFRCLGHPPMSSMSFALPQEKVAPAWDLLLAECARGGVLLRRGGLNMISYSHTPDDVTQAIAVAGDAFDALRAAGFTGAGDAAEAPSGDQRSGPWASGAS